MGRRKQLPLEQLALRLDVDDLDDLVEEKPCRSTSTNAHSGTGGMSTDHSRKERKRQKDFVRSARKMKVALREGDESQPHSR